MESPAERQANPTEGSLELSVVLPCLNEAKTVGKCVASALAAIKAHGIRGEVVVADNGSSDDSRSLAEAAGARVVDAPVRGYGAALMSGIEQARGRYVLMADCDDTYDLSHLDRFLEKLRQGHELVMGSRLKGEIAPKAMPWLHRYIGNPLLTWILNRLFKLSISDAHCGMRAFSKEAYRKLNMSSPGMEFASEMVIKAGRMGLNICEVPTSLSPDPEGRLPHLRTFRDGWRHLRLMLLYSPDSVFFWPGGFLLALGLVLMLIPSFGRVYFGPVGMDMHSMVLGALLMNMGFTTITLGVYSKTYARVEYYQAEGRFLRALMRIYTLERALLIGGAMIAAGFLFELYVVYQWITHHLELEHNLQIRPALWGLVLMSLGWQTVAAAMFLGMLKGSSDNHRG